MMGGERQPWALVSRAAAGGGRWQQHGTWVALAGPDAWDPHAQQAPNGRGCKGGNPTCSTAAASGPCSASSERSSCSSISTRPPLACRQRQSRKVALEGSWEGGRQSSDSRAGLCRAGSPQAACMGASQRRAAWKTLAAAACTAGGAPSLRPPMLRRARTCRRASGHPPCYHCSLAVAAAALPGKDLPWLPPGLTRPIPPPPPPPTPALLHAAPLPAPLAGADGAGHLRARQDPHCQLPGHPRAQLCLHRVCVSGENVPAAPCRSPAPPSTCAWCSLASSPGGRPARAAFRSA